MTHRIEGTGTLASGNREAANNKWLAGVAGAALAGVCGLCSIGTLAAARHYSIDSNGRTPAEEQTAQTPESSPIEIDMSGSLSPADPSSSEHLFARVTRFGENDENGNYYVESDIGPIDPYCKRGVQPTQIQKIPDTASGVLGVTWNCFNNGGNEGNYYTQMTQFDEDRVHVYVERDDGKDPAPKCPNGEDYHYTEVVHLSNNGVVRSGQGVDCLIEDKDIQRLVNDFFKNN